MTVSEALGYNLVVAERSGVKLSDFIGLTITARFQMGIVAKTSKGWKTFQPLANESSGRLQEQKATKH